MKAKGVGMILFLELFDTSTLQINSQAKDD